MQREVKDMTIENQQLLLAWYICLDWVKSFG